IDRQQPVLQVRAQYFHAVGQHEGAVELACGDAAMEVVVLLVVLLAPADDELALLDRHVELIAGEARDRERNPQALGLAVLTGDPLDVVGRVAVGSLGDAVERTLNLVESEQEGAGAAGGGKRRTWGGGHKAVVSRFGGAVGAPRPAGGVFPPAGPTDPNRGTPRKARKNAGKATAPKRGPPPRKTPPRL